MLLKKIGISEKEFRENFDPEFVGAVFCGIDSLHVMKTRLKKYYEKKFLRKIITVISSFRVCLFQEVFGLIPEYSWGKEQYGQIAENIRVKSLLEANRQKERLVFLNLITDIVEEQRLNDKKTVNFKILEMYYKLKIADKCDLSRLRSELNDNTAGVVQTVNVGQVESEIEGVRSLVEGVED